MKRAQIDKRIFVETERGMLDGLWLSNLYAKDRRALRRMQKGAANVA